MTDPTKLSRVDLEKAYAAHAEQHGVTSTKALWSGAGGGIGAALAQVLVLLVPRLEPAEVALSVILSGAVALAATYWAPANRLK